MARGVHSQSVMAYRGRLPHQGGCFFRVPRIAHRKALNKNLSANLFRHRPPVSGDGPAFRSGDPVFQVEIGRVLSRASRPAPPQDGFVLDDVVQPCLPDLPCGQVRRTAVVLHRPEEGEGAGDIVVRHDQGHSGGPMGVIDDLAEALPYGLIAPSLHRPAQVYADDLPQHPGVNPFPQFSQLQSDSLPVSIFHWKQADVVPARHLQDLPVHLRPLPGEKGPVDLQQGRPQGRHTL